MELDPPRDGQVFLSTMPAGRDQRRLAVVIAVIATVIFLAAAPFAKVPLPPALAFISIHESALLVINLITAVLLFVQFAILRSHRLLVLATGYLYAAVMPIPHLLAFPGIVTPTGLLGGGSQTSAWVFVFWQLGYEVCIICYAVLRDNEPAPYPPQRRARVAMLIAAAIVLASVCLLTWLATQNETLLPALLRDGNYTRATFIIAAIGWAFGPVTLLALLRRRPKSVLDLWLLVVIYLMLLAGAMSAILNSGRFDFGFYFGRLYGLAATSFVLINLLIENSRLYVKLAAGQDELRRLTTVDPLTGIANRRAFDAALNSEWRRAVRNRTSLSLLLVDVDCFKSFNDLYGHPAGDDCLRRIARVLVGTARRGGETIARLGGEEFAVLLPTIESSDASALARRVCQTIRDLGIRHGASPVAVHVTISVGVASTFPSREADPWDPGPPGLVERADRALYGAKAAGRDQVAEYRPSMADLPQGGLQG